MKFRILRAARKEADKAAHQYADIRLSLGLDFTAALREAFVAIQARPLSFARSEVAYRRRHIRWCKLRRFRYLVYFEMLPDEIVPTNVGDGILAAAKGLILLHSPRLAPRTIQELIPLVIIHKPLLHRVPCSTAGAVHSRCWRVAAC